MGDLLAAAPALKPQVREAEWIGNRRWNLTFKTGGVDASKCPEIMRLIEAGKLDTSLMITHRAPLNDIMIGYDIFANQKEGCIKWVVTPFEADKPIPRDVF